MCKYCVWKEELKFLRKFKFLFVFLKMLRINLLYNYECVCCIWRKVPLKLSFDFYFLTNFQADDFYKTFSVVWVGSSKWVWYWSNDKVVELNISISKRINFNPIIISTKEFKWLSWYVSSRNMLSSRACWLSLAEPNRRHHKFWFTFHYLMAGYHFVDTL